MFDIEGIEWILMNCHGIEDLDKDVPSWPKVKKVLKHVEELKYTKHEHGVLELADDIWLEQLILILDEND